MISENATELKKKSGGQGETESPALTARPPVASVIAFMLLLAAFTRPLLDVALFAHKSQVYSHILLMPFITGYLLFTCTPRWQFYRRPRLGIPVFVLFFLGTLILTGCFIGVRAGWTFTREDRLAGLIVPFVLLLYSLAAAYLSRSSLRGAAFPLALLLFMAPFPTHVLNAMEAFLQHRSADVAQLLFTVSGMTFFRADTLFQLPGILLEVAPQCSGIRSTLALFITSLVAGYVLLRSPWRRAALAGFVIPLALIRNGFRVFTIGELCVHLGPDMIESAIHRKGGPIFFALSLIPFFLFLLWLRRAEKRTSRKPEERDGAKKIVQAN